MVADSPVIGIVSPEFCISLGKQYEQAIAELARSIALDPDNSDVYVNLGESLVWAERPEEVIGQVERAMRLNVHYPEYYPYTLGIAYGTC